MRKIPGPRVFSVLFLLPVLGAAACSGAPDPAAAEVKVQVPQTVAPVALERREEESPMPEVAAVEASPSEPHTLEVEVLEDGQDYCFENLNREEIEAYVRLVIQDGQIAGTLSAYHEEIGFISNPFSGQAKAGRAQVTVVSEHYEAGEEIPGDVWIFNTKELRVLVGDYGTVGPYAYRALPCPEIQKRWAKMPDR